jgi:hypothetical protein
MSAERRMHALPPLRLAEMKLFSKRVRNGFIMTLDRAPTEPPSPQQINRNTETPLTVME